MDLEDLLQYCLGRPILLNPSIALMSPGSSLQERLPRMHDVGYLEYFDD